jgi:hypothetical protein
MKRVRKRTKQIRAPANPDQQSGCRDYQARKISVGDFVAVGQPLFELVVRNDAGHRPFPETLSTSCGWERGLWPRSITLRHDQNTITELRPRIRRNSRAMDIIISSIVRRLAPGNSVTVGSSSYT